MGAVGLMTDKPSRSDMLYAVMWKLLHAIHGMLKTNKAFEEARFYTLSFQKLSYFLGIFIVSTPLRYSVFILAASAGPGKVITRLNSPINRSRYR